jgi:NADH:ubiquinone oxidoreductase subunit 2 (subunit N)
VVLLLCALATLFIQWSSGTSRYCLFNGLFVVDVMANLLKLAAYCAVSVTLVYSRQYLLDRGLLRGEFLSAAAVRAARHDGDDERQQLPQRVPRASSCCRCACTRWWR